MCTLYVTNQRIDVMEASGRTFRVHNIYVRQEDRLVLFHNAELKPSSPDDIRIIFVRRFWRYEFKLSEGLKAALYEYLHAYHMQVDLAYDCYAFTNTVCNVKRESVKYLNTFWDTKKLRFLPRRGDIIFLVNHKEDCFGHAAVYLGKGLYLAVLGAGGDLEIQSLRDMQWGIGINAEKILIATPRLPVLLKPKQDVP